MRKNVLCAQQQKKGQTKVVEDIVAPFWPWPRRKGVLKVA
jgi:hypothetical protein